MRNPNGYGGITELGGNRRNPFRVRITTGWEYDENTGKHKQKYATLGYFPTRKAAMIALAKYNESPYDIDASKVTFKEVYEKWYSTVAPNSSQSQLYTISAAYQKFAGLNNVKMVDIRKKHLQEVFDENSDLSSSMQDKMKVFLNKLFKYCMEYEIIQKDYSKFVTKTASNKRESIHKNFTDEEIQTLWDNLDLGVPLAFSRRDVRDIYPVDIILMLIYLGTRPGELLQMENANINLQERYMIGGFKTEAGMDRIIPIHDDIFPLVEKRYNEGGKWFIKYKSDNPLKLTQFRLYFYDPVMDKLNMAHLPHDGRHTFATFANKSEVNPIMVKRIMGHKIDDITQGVYTHVSTEEIVEAVNKITFIKK